MGFKVLWVSPLPPARSGVSDYAVEILGPLTRLADVRILTPPNTEGAPELPPDLMPLLVPFESSPEPDRLVVAHFGNNPYHRWILDWCCGRRTICVVHDLVLHHLLVHRTLDIAGDTAAFAKKMHTAHGEAGATLAEARLLGLTGHLDPFLFPSLKALLGDAEALICHSEFAREQLARDFPGRPVLRMKLPVADPGPVDRSEILKKFGIRESGILMMHLGFLTPEKGMGAILGGLAAARAGGVDVSLLLVGEEAGADELKSAVARLGVASSVRSTGWLSWKDMITVPAAADVGIVLRVPSAGETSAAVLRFLACGTPAAVIAQRQFLEWPAEIAPRITPGPAMTAEIARLLRRISEDPDWSVRRSAARKAYEVDHNPDKAAKAMVNFLKSLN